jgi:tetratricopeptide (TPR) repeat protein
MYMNRGDIYSSLNNLPRAVADYSKAINIDHDETRFYSKRADAYRKLGKVDLASEDDQKRAALARKR